MLFSRLFHNCSLKLLSLGLAVLLMIWVKNFSSLPTPINLDVPLELEGLSPELVVNKQRTPLPEKIRINLRAPHRLKSQLQKELPAATINLRDIGETNESFSILPPALEEEIKLLDYNPKSLRLMIEPRTEKTINIEVERLGNVADGFDISGEDMGPTNVTVSGPASIVENVARAVIRPRIEGLKDDRRLDQPVVLLDVEEREVNTKVLEVNPPAVGYSINVVTTGSLRLLKVSPRIVGEVPDGFRLGTSNPYPLWVSAPAEDVPEGVYYVRTSEIDVTDIRETKVFTNLDIQYPFNLPENSNLPLTCDVSVEVRQITEGERLVDIELINRREDMDYNISPERLVVKSEELAGLDQQEVASQIRAWIDVGDMEPGQIKRIPQVDLPLSLQQVSLDRMVVTVSINRKDAEQ